MKKGMKSEKELEKEMERLERLIDKEESEIEREHLMTIRDTIGWVLGHYEHPASIELYGK